MLTPNYLDWSPSTRPVKNQIRYLISKSINKKKCLLVMPAAHGFDIHRLLESGNASETDEWRIVEKDSKLMAVFKNKWQNMLPKAQYFSDLAKTPTTGADFIYADLLGNVTPDLYRWMKQLPRHAELDLFITFSSLIRGNSFFKNFTQWVHTQHELMSDLTSKISRNGVELRASHLHLVAAQWLLLQSCLPRCNIRCYPYHDGAKMFLYHLSKFSEYENNLPTEVYVTIENLMINYDTLLERLYSAQSDAEIKSARQALDAFISKKNRNEKNKLTKQLRADLIKLYEDKLCCLLE